MAELVAAYIDVKRIGPLQYEAWVHHRPEPVGPFACPTLERGPYCSFTHRRAWQKAWKDVGKPAIVDEDDL